MKIKFDSHLHIGDYIRCKQIIANSIYKDKYKLYNAVDLQLIKDEKEYVKELEDFFAIPIVFKEIDIQQENKFVIDYCHELGKGIPVQLIDKEINKDSKFKIYKEHFLLNDYNNWQERKKIYKYINGEHGFIIIHCKDKIRLEYLQFLNNDFPNINYIVAHLGRDVNENSEFIKNVLTTFNSPNFYYDISTILNLDNIVLASKLVRHDNLLFGSDYPYVSMEQIENSAQNVSDNLDGAVDLLENNFKVLRRKIVKY